MQVTKQQILNGVSKYIHSEMIPLITDNGFRVVLETLAVMVPMNPKISEMIFTNPNVAIFLIEKDGFYDLDMAETTLATVAESNGCIPLTIPRIPLFTKDEKELKFSANDIHAVKKYIEGQVAIT